MSATKTIESLKSNDLFKGVDFLSLKFPFDVKNFEEFKEGDLIYSSGQPSSFIYLIVSGEVKLKLNAVKRLFFKITNDFFGESEILKNTERNSSALANSYCLLYKIEKQLIERLINESPSLKVNFIYERKADETVKPESIKKEVPNKNISSFELNSETVKLSLNNTVDVKQGFETTIDIDKIKVKHYNPTPDLDTFIQQKYLDSDNKSLKTQMLGDADDMTSWVITEDKIDLSDSKSATNESTNFSVTFSDEEKNYFNDLQPSEDINQVSKNILDFFLSKLNASIGALYFITRDQQRLEEVCQTNSSMLKRKKSINEGITGLTARSKTVRFCVTFLNDLNYNQEIDRPNGFVGETVIYIPLIDEKNVLLGVVQIGSNEVIFTKSEEQKIIGYANFCSKILKQSFALNPNAGFMNNEGKSITDFILQDIKAPLLSLKHYTAILKRFDLPEDVKHPINLLSEKTNNLVDVLQAVSDFTYKTIKTKLELISFDTAITGIVNSLAEYIESRNVKLYLKQDCPNNVRIDVKKFYVACYYTARFACDIMKQGGNLYFITSVENNNAILTVKDENKIVKSIHINNIFNPDFNITPEAMGISLAIAKFITESVKGTIKASVDGTGTSYIFSIPIVS
ncbi:MAG: cyclic nucleotide-binding domain-containing protein [Ignavibacteriaceae bacterium]